MSRHRSYSTCLFVGWGFACSAFLAVSTAAGGVSSTATNPFYSAASIVNAATQTVETLAPNTIATIYGTNLSWTTHAVSSSDLNGGTLPTSLDGVSVIVNGILCNLFFVSPGQINFLIPYELATTSGIVYVERDSVAGPPATIPMADTAPGFLQWDGNFALAQHADGTLISASAPAQANEIIVLYAVGLGHTSPAVPSGHVVSGATSIVNFSELQILLNGSPCSASSIYYAGLTPGFAGLYQINLKLPAVLPPNPLIQIVIGAQASPGSIQLFAP